MYITINFIINNYKIIKLQHEKEEFQSISKHDNNESNYNYDCQTDSVNDSILHCYQLYI